MQSHPPKNLKGAGVAFLGAGAAFAVASAIAGQLAFVGVSTSFITLGIVFLAKARKDSGQ